MSKLSPKRLTVLSTLCAALALISCNGSDSTGPFNKLPAVANVSVTLPRTAFRVGETLQATALPVDSLGGILMGRNIVWSSSDTTIASVATNGMVTGRNAGTAIITAMVDGKAGATSVQISLVPVASVTITPTSDTVSAGKTAVLAVILKDSANREIKGRGVTWTSAAPTIADVTQTGVVTGMLVGTAEITATVEGKQGKATVVVNTSASTVATITVTPATLNVSGGSTKQLVATLRDASGNSLTGRTVTWTTSNQDRATVSSTGLVTLAPVDGMVTITATAEGKSASASLTVVTFIRMSAGDKHSCGLTADGTAWCWGANSHGQIGDGTTTPRSDPTRISTSSKFTTISAGYAHTCALTADGAAYCWGWNDLLQSGASVRGTNQLTPIAVPGGLQFTSIAPTVNGTCATTAAGNVYCWGHIQYTDAFNSALSGVVTEQPTQIGAGMVAVVGGLDNHYCSVDAAGLAYCWQLLYTYPNAGPLIPPIGAPISTTLHFTTLRVGYEHACGLVTGGQAYCWGRNNAGQLGDGTTTFSATPVAVAGGLTFESIAVGGGTVIVDDGAGISINGGISCGIVAGGKAYCWGANSLGQLGIASSASQANTPQPVAGGLLFTGIRAGGFHACGLTTTGAAVCWGQNQSGQLGDGTTTSTTKPTQVFGN